MRTPLLLSLLLLTAACSKLTTDSVEADAEAAKQSLYALESKSLDGELVPLERFDGKVALVVNTASKCGFTGQYEGLEQLQQEYGPRGFTVLGFPSGDFMGQEFATPGEIRAFCDAEFGVTFPMFEKSVVKDGDDQSPIYAFLGAATGSLPGWNFGKYLVARDGRVLEFFASPVDPTGDEIRQAIEAALAD